MQTPEVIAANLLRESHNPNSTELKILLYQLQEAVNIPGDINCLIGPVVKLLPCNNLQVKRTAYSVLPRICAVHSDAALLAVNRILLDCKDPNPAVKCLAISTLCSLPTLLQEHAAPTLNDALQDGNPKVRRAAVMGCGKILKHTPGLLQEQGFIDRLYECIRDSDPVVVTNSLLVLDVALASEGGVVVNRNMALYLLKRLADFPDVHLAAILQVLGKYFPQKEEDLFNELSILDPYLVHKSSAAVVVSCIQLFLLLTENHFPHLQVDIIDRVLPVLQDFLKPPYSKDSANYVLDFLLAMKAQENCKWLTAFVNVPHLFYPKEKDDSKTSSKKLIILPYLCTEDNFEAVVEVLKEKYCTSLSTSKEAISCICQISVRLSVTGGVTCLKVLVHLMDCKDKQVCENVLCGLQTIDLYRYEKNDIRMVVEKVATKSDIGQTRTIPLILPFLIGEFGELISNHSPYILETFVHNFELYVDEGIKHIILLAVLKMFLKMPAKCQHILGELFEKCTSDDTEMELQHKAKKYYCLLKYDVQLVKSILLVH